MDMKAETKVFAVGIALNGVQVVLCLESTDSETLRNLLRIKIITGHRPSAEQIIEGHTNPEDKENSMVMVMPGPGMVVTMLGEWREYQRRLTEARARQRGAAGQIIGMPGGRMPRG